MSEVVIYQAEDGNTALEVQLDQDTVWLSQEQLAELFGRERSVITKHLRNVFKEGELEEASVRAKYAHTASDGKTYQTQFYNLDVIISVGYRIKSQRGTQFRQWATCVLREPLVKGYIPSTNNACAMNEPNSRRCSGRSSCSQELWPIRSW